MDIIKMIVELHEERDHIDEAILVLSRLAAGAPRRRGRPTGTRLSAAARKAHSERMKKYWATRRKQKPT